MHLTPLDVSATLRNLIDNAIRYSSQRSVVQVAVTSMDNGGEFSVLDQGPGISADEIDRVWQRFYRVIGSGESGSGLGMSIVKRIADLHGAHVALASGANGRGLRASVVIPAGSHSKN